MQTIRQCSVCANRAAGAFLRNQTDHAMLQSNKSVLKKEANCTRSLGTSENVLFRKPTIQKLAEWTDLSVASFIVGRGICATPFTQQVEHLSHDSLIRRAASVVTDSSCTFLSQTTLALIDALTDYSKAVHTRIALQRRYLASLGKLTQAEEDSLQRLINVQRAEVTDRLEECKRFESFWVTAVNLSKLAAEAVYTSGGEQASITLRTNIHMAQSQVEEARKVSADADKKLAETKVEEIQRMAEYAAFLDNNEEHEIHEAYLRED
ncbi:diablo IAP-binding mitochondrial protein-like [Betta splendens]|uniref:Direct IAP-binding protein with low pI n=1 Tax=Betta splendens TaxID=158456 RepID=A0A6P7P7B2_BETSP|nr:diablo IAP-binding mitochondrial protein-like [Betta splendens]